MTAKINVLSVFAKTLDDEADVMLSGRLFHRIVHIKLWTAVKIFAADFFFV